MTPSPPSGRVPSARSPSSTAAGRHAGHAAALATSTTAPPLRGDLDLDLARLSGLQRLQATVAGRLPSPPAWFALGYRLRSADQGEVVFEMSATAGHANLASTVHGGVIAALSDAAMASAVLSVLPASYWCATVELKVNMLCGIPAPGPLVLARGTVRWRGRTLAMAEVQVTADDVEVAVGTSTHAIRGGRVLSGGPAADV
ncbi:PaaI family thioesterase [Nocardioides sp. LHD-245]|uniref:PaaI family thioesterase n=1 Tax=Nocardioides sp. LHD-245 TaxID=3051387 RepID=UPI0027E13F94|nr:PaaI family thioesterase [Nocardioides sp. LHD-245]